MAKKTASRSREEIPQEEKHEEVSEIKTKKIECGLVMPISEIDGCSASHWEQVKKIFIEALESDSITTKLVSAESFSGVIHKRIVQNLYANEIVICDVSGSNPNVMFELGMRLAFDMPTIVVIDDKTKYSYDTSPIEHIPYPRSLNYHEIVLFKEKLKEVVSDTLEEKRKNPKYSTFLGNYNIAKIAEIKTTEVSSTQFIMEKLTELSDKLDQNSRQFLLNQREPNKPSVKRRPGGGNYYEPLLAIYHEEIYDVILAGGVICKMSGKDLDKLATKENARLVIDQDHLIHLVKNNIENHEIEFNS
ncbi:hypothetical protein CA11_26820 [Gimesia maris]|uniref:hypothetical protein n=1 Tax=Gimesia maris TaxID=122 RepID=UPI00118AC692|nr:hypothetical protein [Gimesia maris]QDU14870.1 hypothetical protein CA11_26820 [Gimesia maris]